jgi:Mg/Co/Ni transporter MgtE
MGTGFTFINLAARGAISFVSVIAFAGETAVGVFAGCVGVTVMFARFAFVNVFTFSTFSADHAVAFVSGVTGT